MIFLKSVHEDISNKQLVTSRLEEVTFKRQIDFWSGGVISKDPPVNKKELHLACKQLNLFEHVQKNFVFDLQGSHASNA